ncbi:MAG: ribosome assembly factor SBDS [Candidatus Aenigmarchaeota archaeon ex4484_14]|nr:MAG: ribosome assembly factor SBDS [Candidatus Aenigmarchaeota archaeon ex4484_14]
MVTVDEAVIAKFTKGEKHFEILVDPELAYALKEGKSVSIQKMLAVNEIYSDAHKGLRVSPENLEKAFGTSDVIEIAKQILENGEVQLTTEFKRKRLEEIRKQIANMISRTSVDPKTKTPHPPERILNAMEQAKVHITLDRAENQVEGVVKAIRAILPISTDKINLEMTIPPQYTGHVYGIIKSLTTVKKEKWNQDGSLHVVVSLTAGLKMEFYDKINHVTHGDVEIKEL